MGSSGGDLNEAVRGAKAKGGPVVGISPGLSIDEHWAKYYCAHPEDFEGDMRTMVMDRNCPLHCGDFHLARECRIFEVCNPHQARKVLETNLETPELKDVVGEVEDTMVRIMAEAAR